MPAEDVLDDTEGSGGEPFVARYVVLWSTSIRPEDGGEYRCVVNNTAGQQTAVNITVNVQGTYISHCMCRGSRPQHICSYHCWEWYSYS